MQQYDYSRNKDKLLNLQLMTKKVPLKSVLEEYEM